MGDTGHSGILPSGLLLSRLLELLSYSNTFIRFTFKLGTGFINNIERDNQQEHDSRLVLSSVMYGGSHHRKQIGRG